MNFLNINFQHFTGTTSQMSSVAFYHAALNKKLGINDFNFKNDYLASKKLEVLEKAVSFPSSAKMFGIYEGPKIKLQADYGAGDISFVMTFRKQDDGDWLYPVGVPKEDVRDVTTKSPIVAILRKDKRDKEYDEITYISKNINISNLLFPKEIKDILSDRAYGMLKPELSAEKTETKQKDLP